MKLHLYTARRRGLTGQFAPCRTKKTCTRRWKIWNDGKWFNGTQPYNAHYSVSIIGM